jgi:hypothetical protein
MMKARIWKGDGYWWLKVPEGPFETTFQALDFEIALWFLRVKCGWANA